MIRNVVLFLTLLGITTVQADVTNEDIRVAILQIVKVVRTIEDKLERHEFRDRSVGEQLKKGMINIDRKIKMLDPLKGTVSRLDERLAAVETILIQKNEGEKMQLQRTYEAVIDVQKNLPVMLEEMKNEIISKISAHEPPAQMLEPTISKKDFEKLEREFINKIDKVSNSIGKIENELPKLKEESKNLNDIHNKSSDNLEKLKKHINDNQELLTKYDKKLSEYNNKISNISSDKEQSEWKQILLKALDAQKSTTKNVLQDIKSLQNQIQQLPQKDDFSKNHNSILKKLTDGTNCLVPSLERDVNKVLVALNRSNDYIKNINGLTENTDSLLKSFSSTNNALERQNKNLNEVIQNTKNLQNQISQLPQKDAERKSLLQLEHILNNTQQNHRDLKQLFNNIMKAINGNHNNTIQNMNGLSDLCSKSLKSNNDGDVQKTTANEILQDLRKLQITFSHSDNQTIVLKKLDEILIGVLNNPLVNDIIQGLGIINNNLNSSYSDITRNLNVLSDITATLITSIASTNNAIGLQQTDIKDISGNVTRISRGINQVALKQDLQTILDQTEKICGSKNNNGDLRNVPTNIDRNNDDIIKGLNNLTDTVSNLVKIVPKNYALDEQNQNLNAILENTKILYNQIMQLPQKDAERKSLLQLEQILNNTQQNHRDVKQLLNNVINIVNGSHDYTIKTMNGLLEVLKQTLATDGLKTNANEMLPNLQKLQSCTDNQYSYNQTVVANKLEEILTNVINNPSLNEIIQGLGIINNNLNSSYSDITRNLNGLSEITGTIITSLYNTNNGFESQKSDIKDILLIAKNLLNQIDQLPHKLNVKQNTSIQEMEKSSSNYPVCQNQSNLDIQNTLETINKNINKTHEDTIEKLNDLTDISITMVNNFVRNYDKIRDEIHNLTGFDQVIVKTADSVMDSKRRLEFSVHQIIAEISKNSKEEIKQINQAINDRLDIFEQSILDEDTGALANATSKIEEDIQQVWRQIGIMYQQMSSNSGALKQLQNQTETYVNGSLDKMNNVKGKVGQVTDRIQEVDKNLNYLLGRLSLVTQEFNLIKTGLSSTLDEIRGNFQAVQNKINEGPGPHPIENKDVPLA